MGLLSKVPMRSKVLQHFLQPGHKRWFTDAEKMHMTALWWTPGLNTTWVKHQLSTYSDRHPETLMRCLRNQAYNKQNRERWEHLGQQNIQFIGQPEVQRYFERRPNNKHVYIPDWVLPIWNDHLKQGWSLRKIATYYGLHLSVVARHRKRSIFDESHSFQKQNARNWK